jgi:Family of unknown function (DUF5329)
MKLDGMRLVSLLAILLAHGSISLAADDGDKEKQKIEAALVRMEKSDLTFVRNDTEHDGAAAAAHLRTKLKQAGDQVKTFDDFVDKVATKSSISGKPYLVKMKDGSTVELAKWLRQ